MNTKEKDYKAWLKALDVYNKCEWSNPTSKEYDEAWYNVWLNPKFYKFNRVYLSVPHWYVNLFNRKDRRHNKNTLKKNIKLIEIHEDESYEYHYKHRNSARWMYW